MKKAFTLVEMLIVVVVLTILMTILFRIGTIGQDSTAQNRTVARLQRLEFALSGYHAAFGTYPPVTLQGSRNIYLTVDDHGIQNKDGNENTSLWGWYREGGNHGIGSDEECEAWEQVEAACRSQPIACEFPFPPGYKEYVEAMSDKMKALVEQNPDDYSERAKRVFSAGFDDGVSENRGRHTPYRKQFEWSNIQLFRFGLLSHLLPRYLIMMNCDDSFFQDYAQWTGNNELPSDPLTGQRYNDWSALQDFLEKETSADLAHVANIPSQAACARWMPTFEKSLSCNHTIDLYGVNVSDPDQLGTASRLNVSNIHSPGGFDNSSTSGQYLLDAVTMRDGWGNELYYYSPPPHQSYRVWSSGKNGRTFPPWIARDGLDSKAAKCVAVWTVDDIVTTAK